MSRIHALAAVSLLFCCELVAPASAAEMIYESVCHEAQQVSRGSLAEPLTEPLPPAPWQATLAQRRQMWHEMLGLSP